MDKSSKSSEEPEDRLSELPDSIIFDIFGRLPIKAFVQTTVLSKRWNNLWTTTPYLDFGWNHGIEFVYRALTLWKGLGILKFKFCCAHVLDKSMFSDIDFCVRLAAENGVQDFYLQLFSRDDEVYYCMPQSLYSCSSLKVLSLGGCKLPPIDGNVQWNQLGRLFFNECDIDEHSINQVVSGSPQLEVFDLHLSNRSENLSIQSSSLKQLWIKREFDNDKPSIVTEMSICSPNLETLHLEGVPYDDYSLMNVSSVTDLSLDFFYEYCEGNILEDIFWQIFPALQENVEKLALSDWCIQGIIALNGEYFLSPLLNFKFLTVKNSYVDYKEIVNLLQIFPKLETLVLQSEHYSCNPGDHATSSVHVERNLPESFLLQLRTVKISYFNGDILIFPFIETLLKHASKLQKMVIRVLGLGFEPPMPWYWKQKVLRMPRASPSAELILPE